MNNDNKQDMVFYDDHMELASNFVEWYVPRAGMIESDPAFFIRCWFRFMDGDVVEVRGA